jgi:hypothetical protein
MPFIVDTYNVLHVVGVLPPEEAGIDLPGLIRLIQHSRYRDERVELICDGTPREDVPPGKRRATIVRYSGPSRKADDVIAKMIRSSSIPKRLTIVSSDNEVIRVARKRRCRILASEVFLRQLANDVRMPVQLPVSPTVPKHISGTELKAWQRYFAIDDGAVEELEAEAERKVREQLSKAPREKRPTTTHPQSGRRSSESGNADRTHDRSPSQPLFPKELLEEAERLAQQLDRLERQTHDGPGADHSA